ncbi:MAG: hypothetical protein JXR94_06590 [Candidatus Hydrogenedentes bacterium]|nr:hypothetical protein [Candidatus Hydrogenedentota bacterium]
MRSTRLPLLHGLVAVFFALTASLGSVADEVGNPGDDSGGAPAADTSRWYVMFGSTNNHPRLDDAQKQIDSEINRTFRFLAPGFDDVKTFGDQRDDLLIWTPYMGVGCVLSKRWDVFVQGGFSSGKVCTRATDPSILFLLPLHTDVEIKRQSFFIGAGVAFFPFGVVERHEFDSLKERLKGTRPFVATTLHWNYLSFDAKVKAGLPPIGTLSEIKQSESWNPWSAGVAVGLDMPVTRHSVLSMNVQQNYFFDQGDDFSGPGISLSWKRFF